VNYYVSKWLLFYANSSFFSAISWRAQDNFQWDDDEIRFVLDQHAEFDFFHSSSSLKQQFACGHVVPLGKIILIPSKPVFAFSPYCCVLSGEPMIYHTRGEHANHYVIGFTDYVYNLQQFTEWFRSNIIVHFKNCIVKLIKISLNCVIQYTFLD
jgi:hypothetical protein